MIRLRSVYILALVLFACGAPAAETGPATGGSDESARSEASVRPGDEPAGAEAPVEPSGKPGGAEAPAASAEPGPRKAKVLLLGIDGLDPDLVRKWTADGSMPNLARLIKRGTMTEIDCVVGMSSPVVWTTVATGVPPTAHGITGFRIGEDPVNSTHRRRPPFWKILPKHGVDLATIGWMVSWPAEEDAGGILVSDRAWLGRANQDVLPKGVVNPMRHVPRQRRDEILSRFTTYEFDEDWEKIPEDDPRYPVHYLLKNRLLNIFRRDTIYAGTAEEIARKQDLDVLALYIQGTDYAGHGFWQWFEPEPFRKKGWTIPEQDEQALSKVVPAYYQYADEIVGQVLPLVDEDALVILLSDHGFQPSTAFRHARDHSIESRLLSGTHRKQATLILSGPQVKKDAQPDGRLTHLDVLPTLLYALDLPRAKDHRGRPWVELFDEEFVASRENRIVPTYATAEDVTEKPVARNELDEKIVEELRSLGYIR